MLNPDFTHNNPTLHLSLSIGESPASIQSAGEGLISWNIIGEDPAKGPSLLVRVQEELVSGNIATEDLSYPAYHTLQGYSKNGKSALSKMGIPIRKNLPKSGSWDLQFRAEELKGRAGYSRNHGRGGKADSPANVPFLE